MSRGARRRGLVGLLTADAVSLTGTRVSSVALPWFVLTSTGSTALTGLAAFCGTLPYVLVKAVSGPAIDRIGLRRVSVVSDLLSAVTVIAVPAAYAAHRLPVWLLLLLVALTGAARGPGDAAKEAMTPDAADDARVPLERVTGLVGAIDNLATTVGPAVAAAVIAAFGPVTGLVVDAASFLLGAAIIACAAPRRHAPPAAGDGASYARRLRAGVTFLRGDRLLVTAIALIAVTNLLGAAWSSVLVPVWARHHGMGAGTVGLVFTVMSAASVGTSLLAAWLAPRLPRRPTFLVGFLVSGAPRFLVLAFGVPLWAVLAVNAVSGIGSGFINPVLGAVVYERIPRELIGRVNAVASALAWSGIPLGGLIAGALLSTLPLAPVTAAAGLAYCAATTLAGLRPEWREMDARRAAPLSPAPEAVSRT